MEVEVPRTLPASCPEEPTELEELKFLMTR